MFSTCDYVQHVPASVAQYKKTERNSQTTGNNDSYEDNDNNDDDKA